MTDDAPRPVEFPDDSDVPFDDETTPLPSGGAIPFAASMTYEGPDETGEPARDADNADDRDTRR